MRPVYRLALVLALLAAPLAALAQGDWGGTIEVGAVSEGTSIEQANLTPGQLVQFVANVSVPEQENTTWRAFVNGTVDGQPLEGLPGEARPIQNGGSTGFAAQFAAPNQTGEAAIEYTVVVQSRNTSAQQTNQTGNETGETNGTAPWSTAAQEQGEIAFTVQELQAPTPPVFPWGTVLLIGAVVVVGGAGAYWWVNRDRQIRGRARSKAMQDLEGESFDAAEEEPEVHPQVKILEARAEDIKRMIELAKDRHERGDLTEHQYNTIRENKEAELEEIEEEMDRYRRDSS